MLSASAASLPRISVAPFGDMPFKLHCFTAETLSCKKLLRGFIMLDVEVIRELKNTKRTGLIPIDANSILGM
jgi:hypothetical protein